MACSCAMVVGVPCGCDNNLMAGYFGLVVPEGGPIKATSFVAEDAEQKRSTGSLRDLFSDVWKAAKEAVIGVIGEKARQSPAGQEYEQRQTARSLGELILSPIGAIAGLVLLMLLIRR